jgi:uncharacterized membrane protein (TIGR02234 family)
MSDDTGAAGALLRRRALVPGLLGGTLALLTGAQPWWRATGEGVVVTFTGTETTAGLSQALGVVALAGWLLVLVLRTRGRQVVAVLLSLAGVGIVVVGVLRPRPTAAAVRTQVREVSLADQFALGSTGWVYGYAASGLLVIAGAVLVLLTASRWPQRTDRFSRDGTTAAGTGSGNDPADVWRALDAGLDPTLGPGRPRDRRNGPGVAPDVHEDGFSDTMGTTDQAPPPSPAE